MLQKIPLNLLKDNPFQPRFNVSIDDKDIIELAESIRENGLAQPIKVAKDEDGKYTIIFGHRRVMAHRRLGLKDIDAIVVEINSQSLESRMNALVENIQRENLNPIEIAKAYKDAVDSGITLEQLSKKLGKSKIVISKAAQLFKLDERIKDYYTANKNAKKDANVLYEIINCIKDAEQQWEVFQIYQKETMTRDALIRLIRAYKEKKTEVKQIDQDLKFCYDHQGIKLRARFLSTLTDAKKKRLEEELSAILDKYRI